jgi:hypothetical protein
MTPSKWIAGFPDQTHHALQKHSFFWLHELELLILSASPGTLKHDGQQD